MVVVYFICGIFWISVLFSFELLLFLLLWLLGLSAVNFKLITFYYVDFIGLAFYSNFVNFHRNFVDRDDINVLINTLVHSTYTLNYL